MDLPDSLRMADLLRPYVAEGVLTPELVDSLRAYLELVLRWNAHTNLTGIREPEELVQRQIGESLFAARFVSGSGTLLDFGSGAGFPGIPLQIVCPELMVTLSESQGKKASFLREAVRTLALPAEVWAKRVEEMPASRTFEVVIMRAVDRTGAMLPIAADRVTEGGLLVRFVGGGGLDTPVGWVVADEAVIPGTDGRLVCLGRR